MQQEEIGIQHYFEVLWRRRWTIGAVFTIVFCLMVIGISLSRTTYTAESLVAVKNQLYFRAPIMSFAQGTDAASTTVSGESYEQSINGLPFAEKVADFLLKEGDPIASLAVHVALKAEFREPDLIRITARHVDPDRAVLLANAAAKVFVADTKNAVTAELDSGHESALAFQSAAKKQAEELDASIAQFRREMGFIDINNEMEGLREKIARFEQARGDVVTKLEIAEAHRKELLNLAKAGSAGDLNLDDPRIEEYRALQKAMVDARVKYTENHPALRNLKDQIRSIEDRLREAIVRSGANLSPEAFLTLKEDLAKTDAEIADLKTAIDSWDRQIEDVRNVLQGYPEKLTELQRMETLATAAKENYKTWSNRIDEIEFKRAMVPGNADIMDLAVAPRPSMTKATSLILALIVTIMLSLGMGLLAEFADTTLRTPEEITGTIGLSYLGSIVKLKEPRQIVFADGKATSQIAEAYTRVYSNVKFAEVESPFRSILVTSARKGEGKSTTLTNLACAIAAAGKRVIIVDTDLRNPSLQRILGTKYATGLTSVLAGERTLDEVLHPTVHPGLTLLASGPIPPNPSELLHSQQMKEVIRELESRADLVIFDSPPTLLVADAMLLGGELDAALIVAESGGVSRKAVQQVKESLQVAKTRILGVVLNKILEAPGAYYNYYSYYKYYKEPEEEPRPQTPLRWFKDGIGSIRKSMGGRR